MNGLLQSLVTVGGTMLSMSISALAMIVLSRQLGPEAFGKFNVGFSILLMVAQTADLGINFALNKLAGASINKNKINRTLAESAKLKLWSTLIIIGIGSVTVPVLQRTLQFDSPAILLAAFLLSAATIWFDHMLYVLRSIHLFYQAIAVTISQSLLKLLGIVTLLILGVRSASISFWWYAVAPAIPLLFTPLFLPSWVKFRSQNSHPQERLQLIDVMKHTGVFLFAQTLVDNIDVLFVQRSVTVQEVGLYSGISRIALLLTFAGYALGMVLNPRVARYAKGDHLGAYFKKALLMGLAAGIGFLVFLPFERLAVTLTVGAAYLSVVPYLRVMVASSFLVFATVPFLAVFYSQKQSWYFSLLGVVQIITMIGGNLIFTPMFGLNGATWVKFGVRLITMLVTICLAGWLFWKKPISTMDKNRVIEA